MKSLNEEYHLLPLGDIHYGNPAHDNKAFRRSLARVKNNPNYLTIGMGDYVENNNSNNDRSLKTFDAESLARMGRKGLLSEQIRTFRNLWAPITQKTVGFLIGNHEDRTMNHDEFKLLFTDPLGVKYLGDLAFIQLLFMYKNKPVREYKLVVTHSRFGGQMHGSVMNAAQRAINSVEGIDVLLFGHTHFAFVTKQKREYLDTTTTNKPKLTERKIIIGNTGSFLKSHVEGFDAYTDKKLGSLRDVGTITVTFKPRDGEIYAHE